MKKKGIVMKILYFFLIFSSIMHGMEGMDFEFSQKYSDEIKYKTKKKPSIFLENELPDEVPYAGDFNDFIFHYTALTRENFISPFVGNQPNKNLSLMQTIESSDLEHAKKLVTTTEYEDYWDERDDLGNTPLLFALDFNKLELIPDLFLKKIDCHAKNCMHENALLKCLYKLYNNNITLSMAALSLKEKKIHEESKIKLINILNLLLDHGAYLPSQKIVISFFKKFKKKFSELSTRIIIK